MCCEPIRGVESAGWPAAEAQPGQIVLQFDRAGIADAAAGDLSHRYLWGTAVDQALADEQVAGLTSPGETLWLLGDHLNSVRDALSYDSAGDAATVRIHRTYDAFGKVTGELLQDALGQIVQPGQPGALLELLGFTARAFDADTLLQNNLHRWYDAVVGRWLSVDPMGFGGGDASTYRYVANEPLLFADPEGLWKRYKGIFPSHFSDGTNVWIAEKDDDFKGLLTQQLGVPVNLWKKYSSGIVPVAFGGPEAFNRKFIYTGQGRPVEVKKIAKLWEHREGKPHECAAYDVSALIDGALPKGEDVNIAVGQDLDELGALAATVAERLNIDGYIRRMSDAANAKRVATGAEAIEALRTASNHGRTPVGSFLVIGHSSGGSTSIGGTLWSLNPDSRFDLKDLGRAWKRPSFEDAVQANLPPGFWFTQKADVRFLGCKTAHLADYFAKKFLRGGGTAYGTTAFSAYFDDGTFGWMKAVRYSDLFIFGQEVRAVTRAAKVGKIAHTLEQYYDAEFWKPFDGGN